MFKNTHRCWNLMILCIGITGLTISGMANAQGDPQHGAAITKNCGNEVRACESDTECADTNLCTTEICDTTTSPLTKMSCSFIVSNFDGFFDSLSIETAQDILATAGGNVIGDVPCAAGDPAPCHPRVLQPQISGHSPA